MMKTKMGSYSWGEFIRKKESLLAVAVDLAEGSGHWGCPFQCTSGELVEGDKIWPLSRDIYIKKIKKRIQILHSVHAMVKSYSILCLSQRCFYWKSHCLVYLSHSLIINYVLNKKLEEPGAAQSSLYLQRHEVTSIMMWSRCDSNYFLHSEQKMVCTLV